MCVRFNADDSKVISVGGKDCALLQFNLVPVVSQPPPPPPAPAVWGALDHAGETSKQHMLSAG